MPTSTPSERILKTTNKIREEKPVLAPIAASFEPLWLACARERERLRDKVTAGEFPSLPRESADDFAAGTSLLSTVRMSTYWEAVRESTLSLLVDMAQMELCADQVPLVGRLLADEAVTGNEEWQNAFLSSLRDGEDDRTLGMIEGGLENPAVLIIMETALSTVLRAMVDFHLETHMEPWKLWSRGVCPVCGRPPVLEWLAGSVEDERNPFLKSGSGRRMLHCGLCGADWRFRRAVCPVCGADDRGVINHLTSKSNQSEYYTYCDRCRSYCVGVDMRSLSPDLDLDVMGLALMPYDILAREKGLEPMCRTLWNAIDKNDL